MSTLLRQLVLGALLLAALAAYYILTQHRISAAEQAASNAKGKAEQLTTELSDLKVSQRVVTQYVDRVHYLRQVGASIIQKVPDYVPAKADAACTVPVGFVRVHDGAAQGAALPASAGSADAQPSRIALSTVAGTVVDNYTTCHAIAEQLKSLQEWVRRNGGAKP